MTRAYALLASLLLIATPLAGCTSSPEIEEIVDDILGCMDENAQNYDDNATAELLGDCIYLASMEIFMTAMTCLLYTSPSPRDATLSRMPSSA